MDQQKPKPARNWRSFAKEYVIVVLGVATALAAQQAADWLHDRAKAAEARTNIRAEIARNLGLMERREATEACMAKRLDEVEGLIAASAAGRLPQEALWIGIPHSAVMITDRYKTAVQSGATSLFGSEEQAAYAGFYASFEVYTGSEINELRDWAALRALESHPPASPALDTMLRSTVQDARIQRWAIQSMSLAGIRSAARIGITPARLEKLKMPSACVPLHTPRAEAVKMTFVPEWGLETP